MFQNRLSIVYHEEEGREGCVCVHGNEIFPGSFMKLFVCSVWSLCILFGLPPAIGHSAELEEEIRLPLAMELFLKKPKKRQYEVHVHVTNISPAPVTVDVHDLPWTPPNDSKWLMAFRMDPQHSPIRQRSFLGEFGSYPIRLMPGESVQDKLILNHRIPTLADDIQRFGVQLQWDCPPPALKFVCRSGMPRTMTIPKNDPGQADVYAVDEPACLTLERDIGLIEIPPDHEVLFLLTRQSVMNDLHGVQTLLYRVDDYVRQCHPPWTNSWGVSFFTDERFAGFLRDEAGKHFFEKGIWQQTNIGQYSSQIRTLYRFPWLREKADSLYLSVYRDKARERPAIEPRR